MLTSLILPLFGLHSIYHTFCTLLQDIQNPLLISLCTVHTIFLQVLSIDQILPYNSQFNTNNLLLQYIYSSTTIRQSYYTD